MIPRTPASIFPYGTGTGFPVSQLVYIRQLQDSSNRRLDDGGLEWSKLIPSNKELSGTHDRDMPLKAPTIVVVPLQDALLTPAMAFTKLTDAVRYLGGLDFTESMQGSYGIGVTGIAVAMSLSYCVSRNLHNQPTYRYIKLS
jgi:hypothetical protein